MYYKIKSLEEETVSVLEEAGYSFFFFVNDCLAIQPL